MQKIGVAAVVEGLSGFLGDMGKMDDSIRKLISPTNILGSAFSGLGNILSNVGSFIANTLAHALGELLADAVQWATTQIKELISAAIEVGDQFQSLEIRLNQMNFNKAMESTDDYAKAMEISTEQTKEQLLWIQKLATATPFELSDVTTVYSMARSYNFADGEARALTETLADFTSGMGLGGQEMQSIIRQFGQMQNTGKILQKDLNALAEGGMVPVNRILDIMQEKTGLTGKAFDDFKLSADGATMFLETFTKFVSDNYEGAAQKANRTFKNATITLKEFFSSFAGANVVKPILDVLGERIASINDALSDRLPQIIDGFVRIGEGISDILTDVFELAPSASAMADGFVDALEGIADWIDQHSDDIVKFVQDSAAWIEGTLVPAIGQVWDFLFGSDMQPGAIQKFGAWLKDEFLPFIKQQVIPGVTDLFNAITGKKKESPTTMSGDKQGEGEQDTTALQNLVAGVASLATALPSILELFGSIGEAILVAFGGDETQTFADFVTNNLIPAIQDLTTWIDENQETVGLFVKTLLLLEGLAIVVGLVLSLVAGLAALVTAFGTLAVVTAIVAVVGAAFKLFQFNVTMAGNAIAAVIWFLFTKFVEWKANIIRVFTEVMDAIKKKDWFGAGKAIVDGIKRGIQNNWSQFIELVKTLAQNALNSFNSIFQIQSPSKVMAGIGENIVKGLAKGVKDSAGTAIKAMSATASSVLAAATPNMAYSPAITSPSQNTYQTSNQFNLNVNSSAQREPLLADFAMMSSLVGG